MSPERMAGAAYWASGGDVFGRAGALPLDRALALLQFFVGEAEAQRQAGDPAAARLLSSLALELGHAIARAASWRQASAGGSLSLRA